MLHACAKHKGSEIHLGHFVEDGAELGLRLHDGVERGLQHGAGVQVQRAEAHLLLPKLLLQRLALKRSDGVSDCTYYKFVLDVDEGTNAEIRDNPGQPKT